MSESEIMRNQPLSCTALQQSNHPRVNSNIALNSKTRVDARQRKRREDARALPKLSRNERDASTDFARSAFGVRCVLASLLGEFKFFGCSPIYHYSVSYGLPNPERWRMNVVSPRPQ